MKKYYIYDEGKLVIEGYAPDLVGNLPFAMNTLYKYAVSGQTFNKRYTIKAVEHKDVKVRKVKEKKDPNEDALKIIEDCLQEFGNTNLVKRELKLLPILEKKYRLKIENYKPRKTKLPMAYMNESGREDWIITWLDWELNGQRDKT